MKVFTIKYENGATAKTARAAGRDVYDAIRSLGFADAETFMAMRLITWSVEA